MQPHTNIDLKDRVNEVAACPPQRTQPNSPGKRLAKILSMLGSQGGNLKQQECSGEALLGNSHQGEMWGSLDLL